MFLYPPTGYLSIVFTNILKYPPNIYCMNAYIHVFLSWFVIYMIKPVSEAQNTIL